MNLAYVVASINDYSDVPYEVDYGSLMEIRSNVENVSGYILGIMAYVIIIGFIVITACDMLYLTIPPIRNFMYKKNWDGAVGKGKFRIVSLDARNAHILANTAETGQTVMGIYLKKRIKGYMLSIMIFWAITGGSDIIIGIVGTITEGILKGFKIGLK